MVNMLRTLFAILNLDQNFIPLVSNHQNDKTVSVVDLGLSICTLI